jgi:hypothetical protein
MNKIYKIKKLHELPEDPLGVDKKKRDKIEEAMGKKFTDAEWINYKLMILGLKR